MSMYNGHAEAVKAYGELLKTVPPDKRAKSLSAIRSLSIGKT